LDCAGSGEFVDRRSKFERIIRACNNRMNDEECEDEIYVEESLEDEENGKGEEVYSLKVYGIYRRDTNGIIYVGRTKRSLSKRLNEHERKSMYVKKYIMSTGGFDKYGIELLKECENMRDLIDWESHLILELEPVCNMKGKYNKDFVESSCKNSSGNSSENKRKWAVIEGVKRKYKKMMGK
jgi:hypothetical protein